MVKSPGGGGGGGGRGYRLAHGIVIFLWLVVLLFLIDVNDVCHHVYTSLDFGSNI